MGIRIVGPPRLAARGDLIRRGDEPPLEGERRADIAIVGGGYCGRRILGGRGCGIGAGARPPATAPDGIANTPRSLAQIRAPAPEEARNVVFQHLGALRF